MSNPDRQDIIERDKVRKQLRQSLLGEVEQAKHDLHPRTLVGRWTDQQKARISTTGDAARQKVAKNAPYIGIAAAAGLLFAARKPISHWIDGLRHRSANKKGEEQ